MRHLKKFSYVADPSETGIRVLAVLNDPTGFWTFSRVWYIRLMLNSHHDLVKNGRFSSLVLQFVHLDHLK